MMEALRRLIFGLALAGYSGCGGNLPPNPFPTPTPTPTPEPSPIPSPQCEPGQTHSCWHWPPDSTMPLYACPVYDANGGVVGVIDVTGGPAQCPAKPLPPEQPPTPEPPDPPQPPAGGTNCDGAPGANTGQKLGSFGGAVNAAMAKKSGCSVGSDCNLGNKTAQTWCREVIDELRLQGICSGQHEPMHTDEIAVAQNPTTVRESYHIFSGDDSNGPVPAGGTVRKVVWAPGAVREAYLAGVASPPDPTQPPVAGCSAPLPPKVWTAATLPDGWGEDQIGQPRWDIGCVPHGNVIDCTAHVAPHACDYCAAIGMGTMPDGVQPRCGCPVRKEESPERPACEAYLTGGTKLESRNGAPCEFAHGNPFQFHPSGGGCRLCSVGDPRVCGGWF